MPRTPKTTVAGEPFARSPCPLSCALDILGDGWSLLVIRDLLMGKTRYSEFLASPEGIPTNILADRLKRLQHAGLVVKEQYQENPPRAAYYLTPKGEDIRPVVKAMCTWVKTHYEGTWTPPENMPKIEIREPAEVAPLS